MKHAIDIPPFGELADPRVLAELAAAAENRGWDGFFVWGHVIVDLRCDWALDSAHAAAVPCGAAVLV